MKQLDAKKRYLSAGKVYSELLARMIEFDPNILKVAEEIMLTGDGLSVHDNRFLTSFYKEFKAKSKIDQKYFSFLPELKKAKSELDSAVTALSRSRINDLLRENGIPPKKTNQSIDIIASQINSKEVGLLEKICLPDVLDVDLAENLDDLISKGDVVCDSGNLVPRTKEAREYIRNLEQNIRQGVNDKYFIDAKENLLKEYHKLDPSNLLDFVRLSADKEHIREIERRLDAGDIKLARGSLVATNEKGKKYIFLLTEELSGQLERKLKADLLRKNQKCVDEDSRFTNANTSLRDFDTVVDKHQKNASHIKNNDIYQGLVETTISNRDKMHEVFAELMTLQEVISVSFVDIKKQLLAVTGKNNINFDKLLTLITAVRYLSVYEDKYEEKLTKLEGMLGIQNGNNNYIPGPDSITRIKEKYPRGTDIDATVDKSIHDLIMERLINRKELGPKTNETLIKFILSSPQLFEYKSLFEAQQVARKHVVDSLYHNNCLYRGHKDLSELLTEIVELEIEKNEKISDLVHELELAHKELWLSRITNTNKAYIDSNFAKLSDETKKKAQIADKEAISRARKEIRETLAKYRSGHKKHSDEFTKTLRQSLTELSKGGDVGHVSSELKKKYREMMKKHEALNQNLEADIISLEKRLFDFEKSSPEVLEKALISDIRANI